MGSMPSLLRSAAGTAALLLVGGCGTAGPQSDPSQWGNQASTALVARLGRASTNRSLAKGRSLTTSPDLAFTQSCGFSAARDDDDGECRITAFQSADGQTTVYDILKPVVNAPNTNYPMIPLRPGDLVTIDARGCVQTGGSGETWKRYVMPVDFEGQYFGTATVPGGVVTLPNATTSDGTPLPPQTPIFTLIGKEIRIADAPSTDPACVARSSAIHLQLRYVDDDYGDNGYWGRDFGTRFQCAVAPPAEVLVQVRHAVPGPYADGLAYDLIPNRVRPDRAPHHALRLRPRGGLPRESGTPELV